MATVQVNVTTGPANPIGLPTYTQASRPAGGAASNATLVADAIPVAAAVAVLVADAASPTQAHVTTLAAAYTTLAADIAANGAQVSGNVVVSFDTAVITTQRMLRAALEKVLFDIKSSDTLPV